MQTVNWPERLVRYYRDRIAIVDARDGAEFTYADLQRHSDSLAGWLFSRGITKGDRVAVIALNSYEVLPLFFAVQRLGAILVPLNYRLADPELVQLIYDADPKLILYDQEYQNAAQRLAEECSNLEAKLLSIDHLDDAPPDLGVFEDPCMILYTSGTTGLPKGVVITNKMIFWNSVNTGMRLELTSADKTVGFLPFFHTGAWNVLLIPLLLRGGSVVIMPKFDPENVLSLTEKYECSIVFGVPTTMAALSSASNFSKIDLSHVRCALVGGEAMSESLIDTWHQRSIPVRQGYGLTEFGPNVFSLASEDAKRKRGSIGFPNFYVDVKLMDSNGYEVVGAGSGEAWFQGPALTPGYWNNQVETDKNMTSEGWFKSGDLLRRDEEGYFYVLGRLKDMYISGGENIYPAEIERVLSRHPDVAEVAVIGVSDQKWGEVGKAFIAKRTGASVTIQELETYCKKTLAKYKNPKYFKFVDQLPKLENGKISKRLLELS